MFLGPSSAYTKAEMIEWCESWIAIYDRLPQHISKLHEVHPHTITATASA